MCTLEKRGSVFILTLTGDGEHRLNPTLIDAVQDALRRVRADPACGSALVTTAEGKFFSNGFDLNWVRAGGSGSQDRFHQMNSKFQQLVAALISFPMPTVAAVTGHAAAAGCMLALSHDYVYMRKDRGFLYMSELDIGLPFPVLDYFIAMMRLKIAAPMARRDMLLRGTKVKGEEAVEMGIVDAALEGADDTVKVAMRQAVELAGRKWDGEVYASIRKGIFAEASESLGLLETKVVTASRL